MNKNLLVALILTIVSATAWQPVAAAEATIELVPSSRVILKIIPGMTIDDIIARIYPREKDLWPQIREKLIETNPNSFHPYSDRLVNGARLKLVDIRRIYAEEVESKLKVGYVSRLEGSATARDVNDRFEELQINSQIFEGDRIETDAESQLSILMDDGAEIHLRPDSVIKISEYTITSGYDRNSSSVLDLLRGGFRKITGAIGASMLANYQVQTGFATIGIRGTDYVVKLCKGDDCSQTVGRNDPDAKLHAAVLEGAITLTSDEDVQILMAMGEYATATSGTLTLERDAPVPLGFLDTDEAGQFEATVSRQEADAGPSPWIWILGILLLAAGL